MENLPDDHDNDRPEISGGGYYNQYSQLLVQRFFEEERVRLGYAEPTEEELANAIGVSREMIEQVMDGKIGLGKQFFLELATKNGQTISDYVRDLIRWGLENGAMEI